ncbi:MAG: aspartate kinase, partial [Rikenellaceae bacterium]|nr:aspartate kinase [Rikenellaceae bacterium]
MKVLKFGGTSVGSSAAMLKVKQIVESRSESVTVVASALGGVTDKLLAIAKQASTGNAAYKEELNALIERHMTQMREVVGAGRMAATESSVCGMLEELSNILKGVFLIKDISAKTNDVIVSYGERLSAAIVHGMIAGAELFDARQIIKTRKYFSRHILDWELTGKLVSERFANAPKVVIIGGFIASDRDDGDTTNLGRGGSDHTASILAAINNAESLEIWTDVSGFMTADPKVVPSAYVIDRMTYVEAMELSNFGAKVIYPPTIFPVYHKNIPILIKNTFEPEKPGTLISGEPSSDQRRSIKGISSVSDTCLITIRGLGMVGVIGVNYRIFKALAKAGVSVFLVSQAASENTTSIGVRNNDAQLAEKVLSEEFSAEIAMGEINKIFVERDLATVAIVGEDMKHTPGIAGKLFGTLGRNGINVIACAQGASETNISFVVSLDSQQKAMNVIHDSFFLSEYQVLNIYVAGVGLVGEKLLEQIRI